MWWETLKNDNPDKQKIKELEEKQNSQIMKWLLKKIKNSTNKDGLINPINFKKLTKEFEIVNVEKINKDKYICLTCGCYHEFKDNRCEDCIHVNKTMCSIPCIDCKNESKKQ